MQYLSGETSQAPGGRLRLAKGISSSESEMGSKPPSAKALSCNHYGHPSKPSGRQTAQHCAVKCCSSMAYILQALQPAQPGHKLSRFMHLIKHRYKLHTLEQTLVVEATSGRGGLAAGCSPAALPEPPLLGLLPPPDLLAPPDAGLPGPGALLPSADEGLMLPEAGRAFAGWADAATALDVLLPSPLTRLGLLLVPAVAPEPCFCTFLGGARKSSSSEESSSKASRFTAFT